VPKGSAALDGTRYTKISYTTSALPLLRGDKDTVPTPHGSLKRSTAKALCLLMRYTPNEMGHPASSFAEWPVPVSPAVALEEFQSRFVNSTARCLLPVDFFIKPSWRSRRVRSS
jgi:hypothetical protein